MAKLAALAVTGTSPLETGSLPGNADEEKPMGRNVTLSIGALILILIVVALVF